MDGRRRCARNTLSTLLAALAVGVTGATPAAAALPGSVYTQTNAAVDNEVVVFTRAAGGTLAESSSAATGGNGDSSTPPDGASILDSQGAVELSDSKHLLFAVNAGSDTLSSFRVLPGGGLGLVGAVPTGDLPVSVDSHGDLVYVLNEEAGTIQGYRASAGGRLTPIAGSFEPLSVSGNSDPGAAQIAFDATGRVLTVTHRYPVAPATADRVDTFVLGADGTPGPAIVNTATGAGDNTNNAPFGFAYDANGHAIVSNAIDRSISSYGLDATSGALTLIDNEVTTEAAPCWVVVTPDSSYAYVTNTGARSITRLAIAADGTLTELGITDTPNVAGRPTDLALSPDGSFLTVLLATFNGSDTSQTITYAVGANGSLALLDPGGLTAPDLPEGVSGLAVSAADVTAPDTTILSGPAEGSTSSDGAPTFAFATAAGEPNPAFSCRLDGGAAIACSSPFTTAALGAGTHTFTVAATDFGGNADASPATRTFTVGARGTGDPDVPPTPVTDTTPGGPQPLRPPPLLAPGLPSAATVEPARIGAGKPAVVRVAANRSGLLSRPRVSCPDAPPACTVTTSVRRAGKVTGSSRYSVAPASTARVRFRLTPKAYGELKRRRRLEVTVRITAAHGASSTTKTVAVVLSIARRRSGA